MQPYKEQLKLKILTILSAISCPTSNTFNALSKDMVAWLVRLFLRERWMSRFEKPLHRAYYTFMFTYKLHVQIMEHYEPGCADVSGVIVLGFFVVFFLTWRDLDNEDRTLHRNSWATTNWSKVACQTRRFRSTDRGKKSVKGFLVYIVFWSHRWWKLCMLISDGM